LYEKLVFDVLFCHEIAVALATYAFS